ncbi:MAG TPA: bifunctional 2',3'-cyclic-nucleotide 2'-phosphodiesterase/3'-nucleotidase [Rudaea sp.]|jgi:2',3'-cyclic-nucleotide 2'-phosphodiesterase/3'-nucleotidase|nr:bifunctional 2',3'-cyclic-nucleotide 2'-phosphodiesterase/3'-nucleotidase [Rudaea sp.]
MRKTILTLTILLACAGCATNPASHAPADGTRAEIGILETTDLHTNVMSYDYFKLADDSSLGLERAATLVTAARNDFPNTLLFDDGDTIQGTALADYQALVAPPACDQELAIYKAMDSLNYDAGTIGNHEFNYGLGYLSRSTGTAFNVAGIAAKKCKGPNFPLVLSNVFSAKDGKPLYAPWRVITRTIKTKTADGKEQSAKIRIGLLGFAPPAIMDWDKRNLDGKVTVMGVVEAANKYLPEIKKAGADIVIAINHGGLNTAPYTPHMENAGWYLAQVPGIDAILLGHSHDIFPNPNDPKSHYAHIPDVDNTRGYVHDVPAVMGDYFGKGIGIIDLALVYRDAHWQVDRAATKSEVRLVKPTNDAAAVETDPHIGELVATEHHATIDYVKTPIGTADFEMSTYFVAVGDTSALQIVNMAQRDYVEKYIKSNMPQYASIPVLSAASPFKAGFGGARDYTDVPAGPLAINNAADLYLYPNTITAVKTDGAGVKTWLEKSAEWFNTIDPAKKEPQELINRRVPTYNFDVIQGGLTYTIDITQPVQQRISDLKLDGQPVRDDQPFIVVTNNYRGSGGGRFPNLGGDSIVISAPDANRDALIAYIRAAKEITRTQFGSDRNWHFAKTKNAGPVIFSSTANKLDIARASGIDNISFVKDNGDGTATYSIDLSR